MRLGPKRRLISGVFLLLVAGAFARELAVGFALDLASRLGKSARTVADGALRSEPARDLGPGGGPGAPEEPLPMFWATEPPAEGDGRRGALLPHGPGVRADAAVRGEPVIGPVPDHPAVRLTAARVLELVRRGVVPRGVLRPGAADLPPGIEIRDGAGLGIGWAPGDRLIAVDGVPVTSREEVIRQALAARSRGVEVIVATVARRTKVGVRRYEVVVEQPYEAVDSDARRPGAALP